MTDRVLHILSTGNLGGAEKLAIELIKSTGGICDSYYMSPSGNIGEYLTENGITHICVGKLGIRDIRSACAKLGANVIYAHDFRATIKSVLACTGARVVSHIHHNPPWLFRIDPRALAFLIACFRVNAVVFVSDWILSFKLFVRLHEKRIRIIPNYVDSTAVRESASRCGSSERALIDVLYVGRLADVKNPLQFIQVVRTLRSDFPGIKATMLGDGPLRGACERAVVEMGLQDNVHIIGHVKNPFPFVKDARCLLITSKWEGFSLAAVEALLLGTPVVANNVGGLARILSPNLGFLCDSEEELCSAVRLVLESGFRLSSQDVAAVEAKYCDLAAWRAEISRVIKAAANG